MSDRRPPKNFARYVYLNDSMIEGFDFRAKFIDNATHIPRKLREADINAIRHNKESYINTKYPDNKTWLNK